MEYLLFIHGRPEKEIIGRVIDIRIVEFGSYCLFAASLEEKNGQKREILLSDVLANSLGIAKLRGSLVKIGPKPEDFSIIHELSEDKGG